MSDYDQESEDRANADSDFTDFEEHCANCGRSYGYHETRIGCKGLATYCPSACTVFALPEKDEDL